MTTTIDIPVPDGTAEALLAGPDDGSAPGVLLFMDAYGLRPQIGEMAERVAAWGYTVLAPNVFHRDGAVADLAGDRDHAMDRVRALTPELVAADVPAYLSALRERCAPGPVGTTPGCGWRSGRTRWSSPSPRRSPRRPAGWIRPG